MYPIPNELEDVNRYISHHKTTQHELQDWWKQQTVYWRSKHGAIHLWSPKICTELPYDIVWTWIKWFFCIWTVLLNSLALWAENLIIARISDNPNLTHVLRSKIILLSCFQGRETFVTSWDVQVSHAEEWSKWVLPLIPINASALANIDGIILIHLALCRRRTQDGSEYRASSGGEWGNRGGVGWCWKTSKWLRQLEVLGSSLTGHFLGSWLSSSLKIRNKHNVISGNKY